jgi:putative sulfotransferase
MMSGNPLTIIVGTGRCGSTMLSEMVSAHQDALGLSEFFVCLSPDAFPREHMDGARFWEILSRPRLKPNTLIAQGLPAPEFEYVRRPGRFPAGRIPAVSLVTLPGLTTDPDGLYDELESVVPRWTKAPVSDQYYRVFNWLCSRLGRHVVVERSGGSLRFLPDLVRCFPEARFVHMYRGGPDCALSMSRHPSFRLAAMLDKMHGYLGVDPFHRPSADHAGMVPAELRPFLPDRFDAQALRDEPIPLKSFGAFWSYQLIAAAEVLSTLRPDRLLSLRYESVLADPRTELARFATFACLPDPSGWAGTAAGLIDRSRPGAVAALPPAQREELERACAPGTRMLRRAVGADQ